MTFASAVSAVSVRRLVVVAVTAFIASTLGAFPSACRIYEPSNKPLDSCRISCTQKAHRECSEDECERGCELILDRIVEREGEKVIACVAGSARRCTDVVWADCASHVGYHSDGGPPAPAQPVEDE